MLFSNYTAGYLDACTAQSEDRNITNCTGRLKGFSHLLGFSHDKYDNAT